MEWLGLDLFIMNESEKFGKFKYCQCNLLVQPHVYLQYTIDCILAYILYILFLSLHSYN
jgi:hypothetical protein